MLARVAENIYWLSRYLERAENTVRLLRVHGYQLLDFPDLDEHQAWITLITINGQNKAFHKIHSEASQTSVTHFLLADEDNPGSLINAFRAVHSNLRSCRDIVPKSSYEAINSTCRFVISQVDDAAVNAQQQRPFFRSVEERLQAIFGGLTSNMSYNLGYRFMRLGCYIERADMTSRIIDVQSASQLTPNTSDSTITQQRWVSVLRTLSAFQMYRQHVRQPVNGADTLDYLLKDTQLPRSYSFCLGRLDSSLASMKINKAPRDAISELLESVNNADSQHLSQDPVQLHEFLDTLQLGMLDIGSAIADTYFLPVSP